MNSDDKSKLGVYGEDGVFMVVSEVKVSMEYFKINKKDENGET